MHKTKTAGVLIIIVLLFATTFSACGPARRPGPTQPTPDMQTPPPVQQNNQEATRAQEIAENVDREIKEINAATVVIAGNQAWVGVDARANMEVTDQVKEHIGSKVKEMEPGIQTVYVTADADTVTRIRNIASEISAGRPVSGFLNELMEIAGRIAPTPR